MDESGPVNREEEIRPFRWFNWHVITADILLFGMMALLGVVAVNLSFLDPVSKALGDFNFSDLLYSELRTDDNLIDTSIVMVNIGHLSREEIARQMKIVKQQHPAVIGFDGFFMHPRDPETDSALREAILHLPETVMACFLTGSGAKEGIFDTLEVSYPWFTGKRMGFVNLGGVDPLTSTVRTFSPLEVCRGDTILSMGAALAGAYNPSASERLIRRSNPREIIHYRGNRDAFLCFDVMDLTDTTLDLSVMRGKIVLMGYIGASFDAPPDLEDIYYTPMNPEIAGRSRPDMYGVVIHANIVSMILNGAYINEMPLWLTLLTSFVFCYFYILLSTWWNARYNFAFKMFFNIFLLILNLLLIYLLFLLYHHARYSIHTGYFLAPVLLYPTFVNFYERGVLWLHERYGFKSIFIPHD